MEKKSRVTDKNFIDWEGEIMGYGYGTGEKYTLKVLINFMSALEDKRSYNYKIVEKKLGKTSTWLLINILCKDDILEYGTSPRYGWLTSKGELLREYLDDKSLDELYGIVMSRSEDSVFCYKNFCNCGLGIKKCNPLFFTDD